MCSYKKLIIWRRLYYPKPSYFVLPVIKILNATMIGLGGNTLS
jgi:hypothetical protein